jgi:hypothetical protein
MKKTVFTVFALLVVASVCLAKPMPTQTPKPDEGMWLPMFFQRLNYATMQKMGLKLTAEELYSFNNSSLKDAIVQMGDFCTGEMVSSEGLMFTNHHCGYESIATSSTVEHDYLTNGFWANSSDEEIPIKGLYVSYLRQMYDVTKDVLGKHINDINKNQYLKEIDTKIDSLKKVYSEKGKYNVEIKPFFEGNEYYMFVYEVYKDVRLVGAPPSAIGKFGGDTDNWMWPRHTGDFSIFRIYADKNNNPAEYSKDNVPYHPKHYLPVSIKGVTKDDFAMIWGYPGSTQRYMTSYEVENTLKVTNPSIIGAGQYMLPTMKKMMNKDASVRLKYASDYASIMNMWKNKQGESRGLTHLHIYEKKKAIEDSLDNWISKDLKNRGQYINVVKNIKDACKTIANNSTTQTSWYANLGLYLSKRTLLAFRTDMSLKYAESLGKLDSAIIEKISIEGDQHYKAYDDATERELFRSLIIMLNNLPAQYRSATITKLIKEEGKGSIDKLVDKVYKESVFANKSSFDKFMKKPTSKKLNDDLMCQVGLSAYAMLYSQDTTLDKAQKELEDSRQAFVKALREMNPDIVRYPDANFTMRMTYGKVLDYYPADAVHYDYTTTLNGVMEKEDPNNDEFTVPTKLKQLYKSKDYGQYADKNGNIITCFLTNNDITGGNSGSPVINGNGELIGLAFDGNWEAMSGDVAFEPELQRTICVDARYVLFVIDKYANCQRIIKELQIVK